MKNPIQKITVTLFNLCLILVAIIAPALIFASSESFYKEAFRECEIYSVVDSEGIEQRRVIYYVGGNGSRAVTLSDEQLDEVATHITDYLFGDKENFELTLDRVFVIGAGLTDGVSLFGENAISHMHDVKVLIGIARVLLVICSATLVFLFALFIKRRNLMAKLIFKYSVVFYGVLSAAILVFTLTAFLTATEEIPFALRLWKNLHYLIFPFQPDKVASSELADALTCILTTDFFIFAIGRILIYTLFAVALWLTTSFLLGRKQRKN